MLPRFYLSPDKPELWSVSRAAISGAGIGVVAAVFKTFAPLQVMAPGGSRSTSILTNLPEIACAAIGFALLCAVAAALRNFVAQRLV